MENVIFFSLFAHTRLHRNDDYNRDLGLFTNIDAHATCACLWRVLAIGEVNFSNDFEEISLNKKYFPLDLLPGTHYSCCSKGILHF